MFFDIFKFELNYHRRQYLAYVLFGVFFVLTFLATTTPNVSLVGGIDNININSPYAILLTLGAVNIFSLFTVVAFTATSILRDFDYRTAELLFSKPIPKSAYVFGRFFGSIVFAYFAYLGGLLGALVGELMPWLDQERIGDFSLFPYIYASMLQAVPNMLIFGAIFFCVASLTRNIMWTYVSVVAVLMLYFVIDSFTERETVIVTSILDPFGTISVEEVTRYWTVFEKNTQLPDFTGAVLYNRIVWSLVGCVALFGAYFGFSFSLSSGTTKKKHAKLEESVTPGSSGQIKLPKVSQDFTWRTNWYQFISQAKLEVRNVVFSIPFLVVMSLGLILIIANSIGDLGNTLGTSSLATTGLMVQVINGAFSLSLLIVLIYYAGELMVRERSVKVNEIMDVMPYPNWVMIAAKLTGLMSVIVLMLLCAMVAAIGVQLSHGFYEIDIIQYLAGLLLFFQFPFYFMTVLAVFTYVVTRSKYLTMFVMVLYFVMSLALPNLGFEHYLYRMRQLFPIYSDFTGYGHNLEPFLWQTLYWTIFGGLMLVVIHLLWPRGSEDDWKNRMRVMRQRMTAPTVVSLWSLSTLFVLTGSFIFYNTVILNPYVTNNDLEQNQADYEKSFKQYQYRKSLTITDVYLDVDLYPSEQELIAKGYYKLENLNDEPIVEMHLSLPTGVEVQVLNVPGADLLEDSELGYQIYRFKQPLAPNASLQIDFTMAYLTPGFSNNGHTRSLTKNGTFINNSEFLPLLGYQASVELADNNTRRKYELSDLKRIAERDDESAWQRNGLSGARVNFKTIVSTDGDQTAIAPGYLQRSWQEEGRNFFEYEMDAPIWDFYAFISADYKIKRDSWQEVQLEVYYKHDYNIDVMLQSSKDALAYFSDNFSPYQYRQFRILEFPGYQGSFAQSFPNTIPFSENIGFLADLSDPQKVDYVYYVTAHELAHQWWAHQVLGADVQGSTLIVETLSQYSALMVMKAKYGDKQMERFLGFELDNYLRSRGGELIKEMPLSLVEDQQYIHYRKGSVAFYALQDYLGEAAINRALAKFIERYAFKPAPYPTTRHLIDLIRAEASEQHQQLITDLLEKIVLYDLEVLTSEVVEKAGKFEVTLDVRAAKFDASGDGQEQEVAINDWIEIGVLGEDDPTTGVAEVIHLEKYLIEKSQTTLKITVDRPPVSVGIDPLHKMIDRNPDDNVLAVK